MYRHYEIDEEIGADDLGVQVSYDGESGERGIFRSSLASLGLHIGLAVWVLNVDLTGIGQSLRQH